MQKKKGLLIHLEKNTKVFENPKIKEAFEKIDRKDFILEAYEDEAYEDYPLPIGHGQTISQPTTVAFMLELLGPEEGEKILDVGSGSGWTTALLAQIVGSKGSVSGLEFIPELVVFGQKNLAKYDFRNAHIEQAGEELGREEKVPFDRILVSAAAQKLPQTLIGQLKIGGVLVVPIGDSVSKFVKKSEHEIEKQEHQGFAFVPLIEQNGREK